MKKQRNHYTPEEKAASRVNCEELAGQEEQHMP